MSHQGNSSAQAKKKKSISIDKKNTHTSQSLHQMPKKGNPFCLNLCSEHKKSKSYISGPISEVINSSHASAQILSQDKKIEPRLGYVSNNGMKRDQMQSLGDSFVQRSVNQSYDRLIAESLEAKKAGPNFAQSSKHEGIHSSKNSISFQKGIHNS
jgi:hypothetical protein